MTTGKPRSPPTPKALDIPPDEIITMMDNDWIPAIQSGESTILEIVLPFLDQEAKRVIAEKGRLSYAGQCAHDLRVNACDLRNAIESGNAEMSAALAMLVLARAIENGYGYGAMMLEATAAYRKRQASVSAKANAARSNAALTNRANIDAMVRALPVGTTKKAAARQLEKDGAGSFTWLCNLFSQEYPGNSWPPKRAAKSQPAPGSVEK